MKNLLLTAAVLLISISALFAQWTQLPSGITGEIEAVHMHDANTVVIACGLGVFTSVNGGSSWNPALMAAIYDISFVSNTVGYAAGDAGVVYKTTDGGFSWTQLNSSTNTKLRTIDFFNTDVGVAAGESGVVIVTNDGGATWTTKSSGTSVRLLTACFSSATTGFVAGRDGVVIKTTDSGNTWTIANAGTSDDVASLFFTDANTGFMAVENGIILKTTDSGNSWIPVQTSTTNDINSIYFKDNNNGYAVGMLGTIIKTTDGGNTWQNDLSPTISELAGIHFYNTNNGFAVGDAGTVLKFGSATGMNDLNGSHFEIYPNPSIDYFVIKSEKKGEVHIEITDIIGKTVAVINAELNQKVRHGIKEPGIYMLKITAKNEKAVMKRMKVY